MDQNNISMNLIDMNFFGVNNVTTLAVADAAFAKVIAAQRIAA